MSNNRTNIPSGNQVSYTVENRQFIVRRFFGDEQTVKDLLISEISQGILQNAPLITAPTSGKMEQ